MSGVSEAAKNLNAKIEAELAEIDGSPEDLSTKEYIFEGGELDGQKLSHAELVGKEKAEDDAALADAQKDAKEATDQSTDGATEEKPAEGESKEELNAETTADGKTDDKGEAQEETAETKEPEYKPDLSYKVYDQSKEFPEWAKPLATSKETEENLRRTLQKSEAFDVLKPKHETVIRERDEHKNFNEDHVRRVEALQHLRDKDLELWLHKMGVSEEALVRHAAQIAAKQQDPTEWQRYKEGRDQRFSVAQREEQVSQTEDAQATNFRRVHNEAMATTLSAPVVVDFKTRMDAAYGEGSFERTLRTYGSQQLQAGSYKQPLECANWVMEQYGKMLPAQPIPPPPPAPKQQQGAAPAPQSAAPSAQAPRTKERPKTLPSVGRGTAASPTASRPRNLKEVEEKAARELERL